MSTEIYLDNNATTRPLPEVREAMMEALDGGFGNASSAHSAGARARLQLHQAREEAAAIIGADPEQVVFTSGGTEANNLALLSLLTSSSPFSRLVTTEVEHSSVLKAADFLEQQGIKVIYLPVDEEGLISLEDLVNAIQPNNTLVSIQWVSNETGVIQPIEDISRLCRDMRAQLHSDAAQAIGKLPIDVSALDLDYLSLSGHKVHGPQGVGVLYSRHPGQFAPRLYGGPQEGGLRPGTENLPGIVGLGVALRLRRQRLSSFVKEARALRDALEHSVMESLPNVEVNGSREHRVCNTTNLHFRDLDGQALTARLDQAGVQCSQSSACTNQRPEPSYVLRAMGLTEEDAYASLRFSVSELTTEAEVRQAVTNIVEIHRQLSLIFGLESAEPAARRKHAI